MSRKSAMDAVFSMRPKTAVAPTELEASNGRRREATGPEELEASKPPSPPRMRSGAIAAMGASLEQLATRARAAEGIEDGSAIVELEPGLVDGSFVVDRVSDATDPTFAPLVESIRESGQHVPILVRPHPEVAGRYQVAYGHRRVRAAAALGIRVRAVVRNLTDTELVIAQGKENLDRRDLSYIERAFFAKRLEELSFSREVIGSAMGVHKPDLSNFISVARTVPADIVAAIGPAPKIGGPRWRALAAHLKEQGRRRIDALLTQPEFQALSTDERFASIFEAITRKAKKPSRPQTWSDEQGRRIVQFQRTRDRFNLSIDEKLEPDFGEYLISRLPEILEAHRAATD